MHLIIVVCNLSILHATNPTEVLVIYKKYNYAIMSFTTLATFTIVGAFFGHMITRDTQQDKVDIARYKKQRRRTILLCMMLGFCIGLNLVLIYRFIQMQSERQAELKELEVEKAKDEQRQEESRQRLADIIDSKGSQLRKAQVEKKELHNEVQALKDKLASLRKIEIDRDITNHLMDRNTELQSYLSEAYQKIEELQREVDFSNNELFRNRHYYCMLQANIEQGQKTSKELLESKQRAVLFQEKRHRQEVQDLTQEVREKNDTLYWYKRTLGIRLRTIRSMLEQRAPKLSRSQIIQEIETLIKDCGFNLTTEEIEIELDAAEKESLQLKQKLTVACNVIRHLIESSQIPRQMRTTPLQLPIKVNLDKTSPIPLEIRQILSPKLPIEDMVNR